jgi:hypothetical protein
MFFFGKRFRFCTGDPGGRHRRDQVLISGNMPLVVVTISENLTSVRTPQIVKQ